MIVHFGEVGLDLRDPVIRPVSGHGKGKGVTINGLVVKGARNDPVDWYRREVIAGPLPFVETANSYDDYTRAMTRKLLRELTPALASAW